MNLIVFSLSVVLLGYVALCFCIKYASINGFGKICFISVSFAVIISIITATVLAILGVYSFLLLSGIQFVLGSVAVYYLYKRGIRLSFADVRTQLHAFKCDITAFVILLFCAVLYFGFPTPYLNGFRDPGLYVVQGAHISQTGSVLYESDEFINEHFETIKGTIALHYGGLYSAYNRKLSNNPGDLIFQFMPLFPSALAIGYDIAGIEGLIRVNGVIGILSLLAIYYFTRRFFGRWPAVITILLLAVNPAQIWNGRVTQTEILSQYLYFLSVYLFATAWDKERPQLAALSGFLIGVSCFGRVDTYIWGIGIYAVWFYACIFHRAKIHLAMQLSLWYTGLGVLSTCYGFAFATPYYSDLWVGGTLKGILALNAAFLLLAVIGHLVSKFLHQLGSGQNMLLKLLNMRYTAAVLVGMLSCAFFFAYFIRPTLVSETDPEYFNAHAMVEFCYYTSFFSIPFALVGLYGLLHRQNIHRESLFLFLLISLASIIGYIYRPSITSDHIWASRRWITVNIPTISLFCAYGTYNGYLRLKQKFSHIAMGIACLPILYISGFLVYQSFPFMFTTILGNIPEQYKSLADRMDDNAIYITPDFHTAAHLRFVYGKSVYKQGSDPNFQQLLQTGHNFYLISPHVPGVIFGIDFKKVDQYSIKGKFLERTVNSYPRNLFEENWSGDIYEIISKEVLHVPYEVPLDSFTYANTDSTKEHLISNGESGYFIYGPYITLPQGTYQCNIALTIQSHSQEDLGYVDIVADKGAAFLAKKQLYADDIQNGAPLSITLPFSLISEYKNIEFRVFTSERTILQIENVTFIKESDDLTLPISLQLFQSQNGTISKEMAQSNGLPGYLLFANYMKMPRGGYKAEFLMELLNAPETSDPVVIVDVAQNQGESIVKKLLRPSDFDDGTLMLELPFSLFKDTNDLEMRVYTEENVLLNVTEVTLLSSDDPLKYEYVMQDFFSQNGQFVDDACLSNGQSGFLLYGIYTPYEKGDYSAHVTLELQGSAEEDEDVAVILDVAHLQGQTIAQTEVRFADFADGICEVALPFTLSENAQDLEPRIYVNEGAQIKASNVYLTKDISKG